MTGTRLARIGFVVTVSLLVFSVAYATPRSRVPVETAVAPLPDRHLQPPWWEAVSRVNPTADTAQITILADVLFTTGSSTIGERGQRTLQSLLPELRDAVRIVIAGCTDDVGGVDSPYNINLSWARARAARDELLALGLNPSLFRLDALADTHPVSATSGLDPATINALNRRIIITVTRRAPR